MELPGSQSPRTKELSALVRYKSILNSTPPTVTNLKSTDPDISSPPPKKELSPGEKVIYPEIDLYLEIQWNFFVQSCSRQLRPEFIKNKRRLPC